MSTGTNALSAVTATSPWNAWAVGQYDTSTSHPLIVRWNGRSWVRQRSPNPVGTVTLNAITATSRSSAWAVGRDFGTGTIAATPANVWAVGQIGSQNLAVRYC